MIVYKVICQNEKWVSWSAFQSQGGHRGNFPASSSFPSIDVHVFMPSFHKYVLGGWFFVRDCVSHGRHTGQSKKKMLLLLPQSLQVSKKKYKESANKLSQLLWKQKEGKGCFYWLRCDQMWTIRKGFLEGVTWVECSRRQAKGFSFKSCKGGLIIPLLRMLAVVSTNKTLT